MKTGIHTSLVVVLCLVWANMLWSIGCAKSSEDAEARPRPPCMSHPPFVSIASDGDSHNLYTVDAKGDVWTKDQFDKCFRPMAR